jgi:hypothetical protein
VILESVRDLFPIVAQPAAAMIAAVDTWFTQIATRLDAVEARRATERRACCGRLIIGEEEGRLLLYVPESD